MRLFETLTDEDIADDSYEKLFEKLSIMKGMSFYHSFMLSDHTY